MKILLREEFLFRERNNTGSFGLFEFLFFLLLTLIDRLRIFTKIPTFRNIIKKAQENCFTKHYTILYYRKHYTLEFLRDFSYHTHSVQLGTFKFPTNV